MALLHWYIIPIGLELEFNSQVLTNFADFVEAVEIAMTIKPQTRNKIENLFGLIVDFLELYEKLYVGGDPEKISRCRLCIFQLIHVPQHMLWNGSVRVGSQATVERAIGEVGRKIRSKKAPFAHLANIIHEREMVKLLVLRIPTLDSVKPAYRPPSIRPFSKVKIRKRDLFTCPELQAHLQSINTFLNGNIQPTDITRWGKISLRGGSSLCSRLSELRGEATGRSARYFEVSMLLYNRYTQIAPLTNFIRYATITVRRMHCLAKRSRSTLLLRCLMPTRSSSWSTGLWWNCTKSFADGKEHGQQRSPLPEYHPSRPLWGFGKEYAPRKSMFFVNIRGWTY